jgi:hypothetical protein
MTAMEVITATKATSAAINKAADNINNTSSQNLYTDLCITNLEKSFKHNEQRTNKISNTLKNKRNINTNEKNQKRKPSFGVNGLSSKPDSTTHQTEICGSNYGRRGGLYRKYMQSQGNTLWQKHNAKTTKETEDLFFKSKESHTMATSGNTRIQSASPNHQVPAYCTPTTHTSLQWKPKSPFVPIGSTATRPHGTFSEPFLESATTASQSKLLSHNNSNGAEPHYEPLSTNTIQAAYFKRESKPIQKRRPPQKHIQKMKSTSRRIMQCRAKRL